MTNGLGPSWFPDWFRELLTKFGSSFFDEAAWDKHDVGYHLAIHSRSECDFKFLQAMLRDASRTPKIWRVLVSCMLAWIFWIAVRLGGWMSYNYKNTQQH